MKTRWKALVVALALAVPALAWASKGWQASEACPFPCPDCPLSKR